jgi:hypothetical protein
MSWKKISRPDALPRGPEVHRREAAQKLADWYTGGVSRGDLGARIDYLTGRADRSARDLVRDLGGTKAAAAATGASERTVRDWAAGHHSPSARYADKLHRAARKSTVDALGGTKAVAGIAGRGESTVRTWVGRRITVGGDAVHRLNKHEVHQRHVRARQQQGQTPDQPLYMKTTGHVRAKSTTTTPTYDADRSVCHELSDNVQNEIEDALARSEDPAAIQQIIERDLTENYAHLGTDIYDGQDYGFFLDRIDNEIEMRTEG